MDASALRETLRRDRKIALLLGLAALAVYLSTARFFIDNTDGEDYFLTTESILRGDLWLQYGLSGNWWRKWGWTGRPFDAHGLGQPAVAIPLWYLGNEMAKLPHTPSAAIVKRAAVTLLCPIVTALTVAFLFWFLRRLGYGPKLCVAAALLFAFATMAWPYARYYFSEPLAGLLLLMIAYWAWVARRSDSLAAVAAAGALAGLAGLTRTALWPLALAGGVVCALVVSRRRRWAALLVYGAMMAPAAALNGWYNWARFGSPLQECPVAPSHLGISQLPAGLYGMLLSPGKSFFLYCPAILLAIVGWRGLLRRDRLAGLIVAGVVVYHLLIYGSWTDWAGGWAWGPRFLVAAVPVAWLAVPAGLRIMARRRWLKIAAGVVIAASVAVQILAVSAFYMAHLDRVQASGQPMGASYAHWAHSPIVGAVHTLEELHWAPLGRHTLSAVASHKGATQNLKTELRYTLDIWPAYLRRFGFGRWVWGVFALLLLLGAVLGAWAWLIAARAGPATA